MTDARDSLDTRLVDYEGRGALFEGYFVAPRSAAADVPCVVLAHEWSGLNAPTKRLAERYAKLGYICFALDLYGKGLRGDPVEDNSHLMNPLLADRALLHSRLLEGFATAANLPGVDKTKMAIVGYCFGGLCALDLARAAPPGLKAAVSFHGALQPPGLGKQGHIDASILLLHGWQDPFVPPSDVLAAAHELTEAGADWQLHAYGGVYHAFTFEGANFPERGIVYNQHAAERSWVAMLAHLEKAFGRVTGSNPTIPVHERAGT